MLLRAVLAAGGGEFRYDKPRLSRLSIRRRPNRTLRQIKFSGKFCGSGIMPVPNAQKKGTREQGFAPSADGAAPVSEN